MAVYYTSLAPSQGYNKASKVVSSGWSREVVAAPFSVAMTTAMLDNANDDVGLLWVPPGAVMVGITVDATDMDSATALLIDIGDADDEDRLYAALNAQAAIIGSTIARAGFLYKYAAATEIRAYINTAAGTAVAGTLKGVLFYFVDPEFSTTALTAST